MTVSCQSHKGDSIRKNIYHQSVGVGVVAMSHLLQGMSSFFTCSCAGLSAFVPKHMGVSVRALAPHFQELTLSQTTCYPGKGGRSCYQSVVQISWVIVTRSEAISQYLFNYCALRSREPLKLCTSLLLRLRVGRQSGGPIIALPGGQWSSRRPSCLQPSESPPFIQFPVFTPWR